METDDSPVARPKRKYDDDLVLDLFNNVSLSPHKKLRQDTGLPTIFEEYPYMATPAKHHDDGVDISTAPGISLPEELPKLTPVYPADEKAIVLYKPVNPPMFPGGPSTGSSDFPIKLSTRIFTKGVLDASKLLKASKTYDQFHVFGAQEKNSSASGDLLESEERMESDATPNNRLAVIPWVQNPIKLPGVNMLPAGSKIPASQDGTTVEDGMPVDNDGGAEAMEEDTALVDNSQHNNSILNFGSEPWQHYGVPQPPYTSAMWSH